MEVTWCLKFKKQRNTNPTPDSTFSQKGVTRTKDYTRVGRDNRS